MYYGILFLQFCNCTGLFLASNLIWLGIIHSLNVLLEKLTLIGVNGDEIIVRYEYQWRSLGVYYKRRYKLPAIKITWEIQLTSALKINYSYKVYYFTSNKPEHRFTCKEHTKIHLWLVPCAINPIRTNTFPTQIILTLYKLSSWTREVVVNKLYVVTKERVGWSRSTGPTCNESPLWV